MTNDIISDVARAEIDRRLRSAARHRPARPRRRRSWRDRWLDR